MGPIKTINATQGKTEIRRGKADGTHWVGDVHEFMPDDVGELAKADGGAEAGTDARRHFTSRVYLQHL